MLYITTCGAPDCGVGEATAVGSHRVTKTLFFASMKVGSGHFSFWTVDSGTNQVENTLVVSLSGLESNFYCGSDSKIMLSSMNTNRCATVRANLIPWVTQFIIISLTARSIITSSTGVAAH